MLLPPQARGHRLDRAITDALTQAGRDASIREVRRALKTGQIRVDGRARAPGHTAQGGEQIELGDFTPRQEATLGAPPPDVAPPQILFEDGELLVLAKPSGLPTQPLRPDETRTLLNVAVAHAPEIAEAGPPLEGGLVHRLDVGTSGVVIFAKSPAVRGEIRQALGVHAVEKRYLALVAGALPELQTVDGAIRAARRPDRVEVVPRQTEGAQAAFTEIQRLEALPGGHGWVQARTRFGRRHQVRAHLASVGAPILGDPIYGDGPGWWIDRLALHAAQVLLPDGRRFVAPVPDDLEAALDSLRNSDFGDEDEA